MKQKRLLTMLALLLTAVGGAWAQSTYTVTFAANGNTKTVENVTLPKTFQCSYSNANGELDLILKELYGWTGDKSETVCANWSTPTSSEANKVVAGKNGNDHYITIDNVFEGTVTITGDYIVDLELTQYSLEISIAEPTEWSLTPDETGKTWTLDKMPASNIELQVEYFAESNLFLSKDALADKANIAVKAGDLGVQFGDDGKSANTVTEGTPMTVKFNGTKKLLGLKVEKKAPTLLSIQIDGHVTATIYYFEGETWEQAIQNHPTENSAWKIQNGNISGNGANLFAGDEYEKVNPNDTIDPKAKYHLMWT
jgi:hypothetical protein